MPRNYENGKPYFTYTIDMDDVIRLVYTQLPKMRLYGEKSRVAYMPCKMHPQRPTNIKKTKKRKVRFG